MNKKGPNPPPSDIKMKPSIPPAPPPKKMSKTILFVVHVNERR